jgi:hypothetical protein
MSNGESDAYWRYQATYEEDKDGSKLYFVIEVYMRNGRLEAWTGPTRTAGESWDDLLSDLDKRHADCTAFHPVAFDDLEQGMEFKAIDPFVPDTAIQT